MSLSLSHFRVVISLSQLGIGPASRFSLSQSISRLSIFRSSGGIGTGELVPVELQSLQVREVAEFRRDRARQTVAFEV